MNDRRWLPSRVAQSCSLLLLSKPLYVLRNHCIPVSDSSFVLSQSSPIILDSFELSFGVFWDKLLKHFRQKLKVWNPERTICVYHSDTVPGFYRIENEENGLPRFVIGNQHPIETDRIILEGSLIWHFIWFVIKISRRTCEQLKTQDENNNIFMDEIELLFQLISPFFQS